MSGDKDFKEAIVAAAVFGISIILSKGAKRLWENREKIFKYFDGKNLVILGGEETGKTTLHHFIRNNELVETKRTLGKTDVPSAKIHKNNVEIKISKGIDVGGTNQHIPEWKQVFSKSDICIYTLNIEKIDNGDKDYLNTIYKHLNHISQWKAEFKRETDIYIFGLFADKIKGYSKFNDRDIQNLKTRIELKLKKALIQVGLTGGSRFFIGSLFKTESAEKLIEDFLIQASNQNI